MRYLLIIPDGVGIRNFLCTNFIDHLLEQGDVVIWHALPQITVADYKERWGLRVQWLPLPTFREGIMERVLRRAKVFGQLYWQSDPDALEVMLKRLQPRGRWQTQAIGRTAHLLGRLCATASGLQWLDRQHAKATQRAAYTQTYVEQVVDIQPDVVFCTHQRASHAVPAMLACRMQNIPTATFIYSWDNLPKGRMAVQADQFLLWSEHMQAEMRRYYPEISSERLHVVGTPQFEHYFKPNLAESRDTFLTSLGLDPTRRVVCFSGDDVATSPHDPHYLADLAEAMRQVPFGERPQILFRRCPVDLTDRYQWVLDQYSEIVVSDPLWATDQPTDWTQIVPTEADVKLLVNVVKHCALVINLGSTMALDFAIEGKPGVYVAYEPHVPDLGWWRAQNMYRLPHFKIVHALQPVFWVRQRDAFREVVMTALQEPQKTESARLKWLETIVQTPLEGASRRFASKLTQIGQE